MSLILIALLGCNPADKPGAGSFQVDASASLAELVPTVIQLEWSTDAETTDDATVWVETASGESWTQPLTESPATLWGFKASDDVTLTVSVSSGGETVDSEPIDLTTGSVPADLGGLTMTGDPDGALDGGLLLTTSIQGPQAAVLIDEDGDYRWWAYDDESTQLGRARLSVDGQSVLMMPVNNNGDDESGIKQVALDGTPLRTITYERMHHDFVEHSDGTLAFISRESREVGGSAIIGDRIVEVTPDGTETIVWSVWDQYEPYEGKGPNPDEWTHSNTLVFDEADQTYSIGNYGMHNVIHIDRATGDVLWVIGGQLSDFVDDRGSTDILDEAHQFEILDGSFLIFENGPTEDESSRAVEFSFDPAEPEMDVIWEYRPDPELFNLAMGDVKRFDSGNTLVDFSVNGQIVEVNPAGEVQWQLNTSLGAAFGYVQILHGVAGR